MPNLDHIQPLFGGGGRVRMTQFMDVNAAPRVNCVGEWSFGIVSGLKNLLWSEKFVTYVTAFNLLLLYFKWPLKKFETETITLPHLHICLLLLCVFHVIIMLIHAD